MQASLENNQISNREKTMSIIQHSETIEMNNQEKENQEFIAMQEKELKGLEKVHTFVKIAISLSCSIFTLIYSSIPSLACLFIFSLIYALFVPKIKILFIAYPLAIIMYFIAVAFSYLMSLFTPIPFHTSELMIPFMRMLIMLNAILPLALSTKIQNILTSLKSMKLPFCIYLPSAVMIRFIPTFINDVKQVSETLKIRGYKMNVFETIKHPILMLRLLFTPLLFRSLKTSEELGIAGELKGLSPNIKMSSYKKERWNKQDFFIISSLSVVILLSALLEFYFVVEKVSRPH